MTCRIYMTDLLTPQVVAAAVINLVEVEDMVSVNHHLRFGSQNNVFRWWIPRWSRRRLPGGSRWLWR